MLIEFRVENHRSLRTEQALTLEAGRLGSDPLRRPRLVEGHKEELLPVAAIYGANASGKSNILSALAFMRSAVVFSHRNWAPDEGIPREAFAWGGRDQPSLFEVKFLSEGVRYEYGFLADSQSFIEEWLYAWPNGWKQTWYERDSNSFKFGDELKGENKLIEEVTRPNALFLSAAVQHKHQQLTRVFNWFRDIRTVNLNLPRTQSMFLWRNAPSHRLYDIVEELQQPNLFGRGESDSLSDRFLSMLRNADIGIEEVRVVKGESDDAPNIRRVRFQLKHKGSVSDSWLPLEEESQGTQKLFHMALPVLETIQYGKVLLVDELEASLHPTLAQEIVNLFNDPAKNPYNAQLIFSTHDTNLLGTTVGEPALRRDQVWLTEKDDEGGTVLYPLTNYKPRNSENLERGYLQGRYGAIPFLGKFAWNSEETADDQTPRTGS